MANTADLKSAARLGLAGSIPASAIKIMNLKKIITNTVNRFADEFSYWTAKIPAQIMSEEYHKLFGCPIVKWPKSFVMVTDNPYKGVFSTIDYAGLRIRYNKIIIEKDDPFIVIGDFSDKGFAVYGAAILEEHNIVEFMDDKVLGHCGWVCILQSTKVRRLKKDEKYEKNSSV